MGLRAVLLLCPVETHVPFRPCHAINNTHVDLGNGRFRHTKTEARHAGVGNILNIQLAGTGQRGEKECGHGGGLHSCSGKPSNYEPKCERLQPCYKKHHIG